jgi:hypothetical protein
MYIKIWSRSGLVAWDSYLADLGLVLGQAQISSSTYLFVVYLMTLSEVQTFEDQCSMPSNFSCYTDAQQPLSLLLENSLYYAVVLSFFLRTFLLFSFPTFYALFYTFISERDCTPLQCFYKGCIQSNQQLALSRLMHSIHCGSAIFPYQAF